MDKRVRLIKFFLKIMNNYSAILVFSLIFPLMDIRFRRSAYRFRLFRLLMPDRFVEEFRTKLVYSHASLLSFIDFSRMTDNRVGQTDHYFDWLNRDLR